MKIQDILDSKDRKVVSINKEETVHQAIRVLVEHNIGALLVLDQKEKLVGIISERDILRECADRASLLQKTKVSQVMTTKLIIGVSSDDMDYTMGIMTKNRVRHMPIMEGGNIAGIVSIGDLVKHKLEQHEYDNRYLQQYMFGY